MADRRRRLCARYRFRAQGLKGWGGNRGSTGCGEAKGWCAEDGTDKSRTQFIWNIIFLPIPLHGAFESLTFKGSECPAQGRPIKSKAKMGLASILSSSFPVIPSLEAISTTSAISKIGNESPGSKPTGEVTGFHTAESLTPWPTDAGVCVRDTGSEHRV